ncbi:hypothetical protein CDL15_Pgr010455 [Punica granatum]|uniref:Uncharacterized protein n=1 Tax=Punica granatum TaxID=22663 RepID=A0A218VVW3_PUNGR|nr:hypothetical protein CDL15_Pgr010455 [Punica granatum]
MLPSPSLSALASISFTLFLSTPFYNTLRHAHMPSSPPSLLVFFDHHPSPSPRLSLLHNTHTDTSSSSPFLLAPTSPQPSPISRPCPRPQSLPSLPTSPSSISLNTHRSFLPPKPSPSPPQPSIFHPHPPTYVSLHHHHSTNFLFPLSSFQPFHSLLTAFLSSRPPPQPPPGSTSFSSAPCWCAAVLLTVAPSRAP